MVSLCPVGLFFCEILVWPSLPSRKHVNLLDPFRVCWFTEILPLDSRRGTSLCGPVVKNPPSSAGDTGLIPGQGTKIPGAVEQLSLRAATTEPTHLN